MNLADLDAHITGNYGQDQYRGDCDNALCPQWLDCPHNQDYDECRREVEAARIDFEYERRRDGW